MAFYFYKVLRSFLLRTAVLFKVGQDSMMMKYFQVILNSWAVCWGNGIVGFQEGNRMLI